MGPITLVVRCFMVSAGGVCSMSFKDTYPAVLTRILGNALSAGEDVDGATISFSNVSNADCTDSGNVMSHAYVRMSSAVFVAPAYPASSSSSRRSASNGAYRIARRAPCCLSFLPMLEPRPPGVPLSQRAFACYSDHLDTYQGHRGE